MVPFGGWDMPVQYAGIVEEHRRCAPPSASSTSATWASSRWRGAGALAAVAAALHQ
jgi:glycine cleavage system aminomethyltransferase T